MAFLLALSPLTHAANFTPIFDGKSLKGWKSPNMSYWSVKDGAITATSSKQNPCKQNQFLVWQLGPVDDFELKLDFKISGTKQANSGIQFRSAIESDGHAVGYQADIGLSPALPGFLYDEKTGRGGLASRGHEASIDASGKKSSRKFADPAQLLKIFKPNEWNTYHVIARGKHIELRLNGKTMSKFTDNQPSQRDYTGKLALQLHSGPPMTVQFKNIQLKRLKLNDGRKKIVAVAGRMSHGPGAHEFNAGVKLLAKSLEKHKEKILFTNIHDAGWPKDPTAFDNADAIVLYMDGGGRHPILHHLSKVDKFMEKGVGLMCMHYAVEVPKGDAGDHFRNWIGGYYETHWSINPHWKAKAKLQKNHPIVNGVKPFEAKDEWYFNMRSAKVSKASRPFSKPSPTRKPAPAKPPGRAAPKNTSSPHRADPKYSCGPSNAKTEDAASDGPADTSTTTGPSMTTENSYSTPSSGSPDKKSPKMASTPNSPEPTSRPTSIPNADAGNKP